MITAQAQSAGASVVASFTANPTAGAIPLTVSFTDASSTNVTSWIWQFGDGSPSTQLQNPVYTYTNAGLFTVTLNISDDFGDTDSTNLTIQTFAVPPSNDNFSSRITVTGTSNSVVGSNVGATREPGEPFDAGVPGGQSVWWSWTAPASGVVTISTAGSSFDTTLGVYTGNSISNLTLIASNDDADPPSVLASQVSFQTRAFSTYQISVDGSDADTIYGSNGVVYLSVVLQPPVAAPAWNVVNLHGAMLYSTNYAGQVVLLDFWSTTCDVCSNEISSLIDLQQKYGSDGLSVVGVNVDSGNSDPIYTYATNNLINYEIVRSNTDMDQAFGWNPQTSPLPTIFLVGRDNQLSPETFVGSTPEIESTLEQAILPLLYNNLQISICTTNNAQLLLWWPKTQANTALQTTADLNSGVWTTSSAPIQNNSVTRSALLPPGALTNRYFRLRIQ